MNYTLNVSIPKPLVDRAKEQVKKGYYTSFSEVVRAALRDLLLTDIPEYKMSKRMEKLVDKAIAEYNEGKIKPISSLKELE